VQQALLNANGDMDEASRLVSELQSKLAALDDKVARYQRDMASEFTKYAADLLRNVSADVSEDVSRRIAQSVNEYPALNLKAGITESCADGTGSSNGGGVGGSTVDSIATARLESRQDDGDESPRSPHEREKEFQGLFTPSYLPLLDSNDRNERRSSSDFRAVMLEPTAGTEDMEAAKVDASTDTRSLAGTPEPSRPLPKRRNTDEASSGSSDLSEGIHRRSALRRSSTSSTRTSPRRVRFEVGGEEVLPTSSPYSSGLTMAMDTPVTYQILNEDLDGAVEEELEDIAEAEQIEDIDDEPPPTRRVSSSQALRALSRGPFVDDGTHWTTVTAPPDGSASIAISGNSPAQFAHESADDLSFTSASGARARLEDSPASSLSPTSTFTSQNTTANTGTSQPSRMPSSHDILERHDAHDPEASDYSSDDDMLDMPALTSMRGKRSTAAQPASPSPAAVPLRSPHATTRPGLVSLTLEEGAIRKDDTDASKLRFSAEDEDEMFSFEENQHHQSPPEPEVDEPESSASMSPTSPSSGDESRENLSKSPARPIPNSFRREGGSSSSGVGSSRGHPFQVPIISPEMHEKIEKMGDFNSFVGSVHGRSGVDDCDPLTFRNSIGKPTYKNNVRPETMQDRMAHEEWHEGRGDDSEIDPIDTAKKD
jgi:hypothetical protein